MKDQSGIEAVSQIQRFRHDISGHPNGTRWAVLTPDDKGSVVYYSDYAHLLRSHEATQAALKELEWIRDHVAEYGKNCNAPVVFSRASRALKAVDAALTEAAAQKENGNG